MPASAGIQNLFHIQSRDALWPGRTVCKAPDEGHMSIWSRRATMQTTVLAGTPKGTGRSGRISLSVAPNIESMRRRDPPRTASHLASVAHVPVYEIGS